MRHLLGVGIITSLMMGCSIMPHDKKGQKAGAGEQVEVRATFQGESFSLTNTNVEADDFIIKVEGCASGHEVTLTKADADASLYLNDKNCVGKLISLTVNGEVYTLSSSDGFSNYQPGDDATYENAAKTKSLQLVVVEQIAKKLDPAAIDAAECQNVIYAFRGIDKGNRKDITPDAVGVKGKVIGDIVPAFQLDKAWLFGINDNGSGQFGFDLKCNNATLTPAQMATCVSQIPGVKYLLIEDTFGGVLTLAQADALFASNASYGPQSILGSHFTTQTLDGPAQIALHKQMLLVVQYGGSYQYFEVDVLNLPDVQCESCDDDNTPPVQMTEECDSAFAFGQTTFVSLGLGNNRWGWQLTIDVPNGQSSLSGSAELWAGAGQNNLNNGTLVGRVDYSFDRSDLDLTYVMSSGYYLKATHVYAGSGNVTTTAPGQFGHQHVLLNTTSDRYDIDFQNSVDPVKVVAHAEVCHLVPKS